MNRQKNSFFFRLSFFVFRNASSRFVQKTPKISGVFLLFSFFFFLFFVGCKSQKKVVESPSASTKLKGQEVIQAFDSVLAHQFQFKYLTAKAAVDYTDRTGDTKNFDINIRMKRDSAVWISVCDRLFAAYR